jgi:hypothetical protein
MAFTSQSLAKARDYAERMSHKMAKLREHAEEAIGNGILVTEVGGTSFAFGYANGRWGEDGEMKMLGVPVELGVGFALTGVAMFGGLGKYGEHGVNIGSGALASFVQRHAQWTKRQGQGRVNDLRTHHAHPGASSFPSLSDRSANFGLS